MKIVKIEKKDLNKLLEKEKHSQFLQSWEWGVFQEDSGNEIFRLGVELDGVFVAVATLIKKSIGLGKNYFYCPRGPIISTQHTTHNTQHGIEEFLFNEIKNLAKKEGSIFLRLEPLININNSTLDIRKSIDLQPKKTLMLDLSLSEDVILKGMHQKTRYNIRLAQKKGVEIVKGSVDDFDNFWNLMGSTSERDGFRTHGKEHYRKLLNLDFVKIYFAKYNNKIVATALFSFFGDTVTYMHGASANEHRNVMAPFLLQWEAAMLAKGEGYKYYDFYGIDEKKWPGVTRFKKGFGGFELDYPGTLDMVFNWVWYNVYQIARKVRRGIK
ncbi:MAG: peptidoglycan bridge formation glycyltransferase FemA/FemB family protein [Patescibacteria group bacterium]|jgi:peptidoglycan pentaglycine glycine transferase (the first glycine)|nr:peptidoglycan bridge formation glycyltransferase FemA/FemB family protein [Patescibacteria group bacterium]